MRQFFQKLLLDEGYRALRYVFFSVGCAVLSYHQIFIAFKLQLAEMGWTVIPLFLFLFGLFFLLGIFYYYCMRKIIVQGRFVIFILLNLAVVLTVPNLLAFIKVEFMQARNLDVSNYFGSFTYFIFNMTFGLEQVLTQLGFTAIALYKKWFLETNSVQELEKEISESEIEHSRRIAGQHYIINTLQSAKQSVYQDKTKSVLMLEKLGKMLRYELYQPNLENTGIRKEMEIVRQFLELESLNRKNFSFQMDQSGLLYDVQIPKNLLLTLIQNLVSECKNAYIKVESRANTFTLFISSDSMIKLSALSRTELENGLLKSGFSHTVTVEDKTLSIDAEQS